MQNKERRYMKVIYDSQGNIYHQMMDIAPDPVGSLKFAKVDVPIGKNLVRFEMKNGKAEPVFLDRPLTDSEKIIEKLTKMEGEITDNQLALAELSTEK